MSINKPISNNNTSTYTDQSMRDNSVTNTAIDASRTYNTTNTAIDSSLKYTSDLIISVQGDQNSINALYQGNSTNISNSSAVIFGSTAIKIGVGLIILVIIVVIVILNI